MLTQRIAIIVLLIAPAASAEVHSLTLQQALDLASRQNPDVALARLDQQRADEGIRIAQDPFRPKMYAGSGLAYTYGYPSSIEGNAPSIFQTRTDMALYNRPKSYEVAAARQVARGAELGAEAKLGEVAYQAADLFLSASQIEHESDTLSAELPSLQRVVQVMAAAVEEGSQLPVELKRARVNMEVSEQRLGAARLDRDYYEMMLAVVLGFPATDRVKPVDSDVPALEAPASENEATDAALQNSRELRQMEANMLAKQLDIRSYKAARLPQMDLVAQYALFAKYNYQQYFQKFQRNNVEIGASITIPILIGPAPKALAEQAYTDLQKLRIQMDQERNRIITETRRSYEQWKKAESFRDVVREQLDLVREDLTIALAQNGEGRVSLKEVEQKRLDESDRWIALYDAETQVTRAKLAVLRQTGTLLAAVHKEHGVAHPQ